MYACIKYYICIMVVRYYTFFNGVTLLGSGSNALKNLKNNTITNISNLKVTISISILRSTSEWGNEQVRFGRNQYSYK